MTCDWGLKIDHKLANNVGPSDNVETHVGKYFLPPGRLAGQHPPPLIELAYQGFQHISKFIGNNTSRNKYYLHF